MGSPKRRNSWENKAFLHFSCAESPATRWVLTGKCPMSTISRSGGKWLVVSPLLEKLVAEGKGFASVGQT
jgi:hypothetical protein